MTSTTQQPASLLTRAEKTPRPETGRLAETAQPRQVTLCWDLATRAGAGLALNGHTQHNADNTPDHAVAIELTIDPTATSDLSTVRLHAVLHSGERATLRTLEAVRTRRLCEAGFVHVDIEGVIACTFRAGDTTRPIYARCPLLAAMGIPAGSYSMCEASAE